MTPGASSPRRAAPGIPAKGLGCLTPAWILETARNEGGRDPRETVELVRVDPHPRTGSPRREALCLEMRLRRPDGSCRTIYWIVARPRAGEPPSPLLDVFPSSGDRRLPLPPEGAPDPALAAALEIVVASTPAAGKGRGPWRSSLLGHRPGRRAAMCFTRGEQGVVVKILRGGRAERLALRVGRARAANPGLPCLPHFYLETTPDWIYMPYRRGMTLHAAWTDLPSYARGDRVLEAARVLAAVHGTEGPVDAAPRGLADAIAAIDRPLGILRALGAPAAAGIQATRQRLEERTRGLEGSAPRLAHGDVHDKQFLFTREASCVLLDWDGLGKAPPEEDRANFRAHLRLRALQGLLSPAQAASFERGFVEESRASEERPETAGGTASPPAERVYLATALARLAAVYALRPRWAGIVDALRDAADREIDGLDG